MKVKELIKRLKEICSKEGNEEVFFHNGESENGWEINNVTKYGEEIQLQVN